jgi:hypothetical protein
MLLSGNNIIKLTMKTGSILIIFLFLSIFGYSQDDEYHPLIRPGLEWNVTEYANFDYIFPYGKGKYFFGEDTLIGEQVYTKILYHPYVTEYDEFGYPGPWFIAGNITIESWLYIREDVDERRVYLYDSSEDGMEGLIYDFSLNSGDTLRYDYPWWGVQNMVVTVDTIQLVNGDYRKIFYTYADPYVEGLGGTYQGLQFPLLGNLSGGAYVAGCFSEYGEVLWGAPASSSCGLYLSTADELLNYEVSIFPNPAMDILTIDLPIENEHFSISIIDLEGRELSSQSTIGSQHEIDISSFPNGIYLLEVRTEKGRTAQKKFVKSE